MIARNEALNLLGCFFRGDSPFEQTKELSGHASSGIPDIFFGWFAKQADEDKQMVANVLAESVIEGGELDWKLPQACFLMVEVAARYPSAIPEAVVARAEQLLRRGDSVNAWLNDKDGDGDDQKDFRSRWRFALALWNLLWFVGSPVAGEIFNVFAEGAKDPHFARSIRLAKSVSPTP